jgi:hypothetical protein
VKRMRVSVQKCVIYLVIATTMCSLVYVPALSGLGLSTEQSHFRPSDQGDTLFGNFSAGNTHAYSNGYCQPDIYIDVQDPDGVDTVWVSYRRANETSVLNKTMDESGLGDSNSYFCYIAVFVSEAETYFIVRFYANDSLGFQTSSDDETLKILYNPPNPTSPTSTSTETTTASTSEPLELLTYVLLAVSVVSSVIIITAVLRIHRHKKT